MPSGFGISFSISFSSGFGLLGRLACRDVPCGSVRVRQVETRRRAPVGRLARVVLRPSGPQHPADMPQLFVQFPVVIGRGRSGCFRRIGAQRRAAATRAAQWLLIIARWQRRDILLAMWTPHGVLRNRSQG